MKGIFLLIAIFLPLTVFSQVEEESENESKDQIFQLKPVGQFRIGIASNTIMAPESATGAIVASFNPDTVGGRGSFGDNYISFNAAYAFGLNSDNSLRLPVGLEFTRFSAAEVYLFSEFVRGKYRNAVNVLTVPIGLEYDLMDFFSGSGQLYVGLGADFNYVFGRENEFETIYIDQPVLNDTRTFNKEDAMRLGGRVLVGFQGDFVDNIRFSATAALISLNLVQFNETQGRLMTPITGWPDEDEVPVYTYRLGFNMIFTVYNR